MSRVPERNVNARKRVTSVDVARRCGVSQSTVSLVLSGKGAGRVSARTAEAVRTAAAELGYPHRDVCMKPLEAKGSRGFRVLSANADRCEQLLGARPGTLLPLSLADAVEILDGGKGFPEMLVMELVEGEELAVDALCRGGRTLIASAKTREAFRAGLAMEFRIIDRPDLLEHSRRLVEALALDWIVNVQFLGDRLLEINPRISTLVYQPDLNLPWLAVKRALGELTDDEVAAYDPRTRIGRRVTRYYEQTEYEDQSTTGSDRPPGRP